MFYATYLWHGADALIGPEQKELLQAVCWQCWAPSSGDVLQLLLSLVIQKLVARLGVGETAMLSESRFEEAGAGGILTSMEGDWMRALTGCSRGSKRSSWGAPGFLKLPESLNTESEAAFTAAWSTLEAGSCAVPALSSLRRSAEYSPALKLS